MAVREKRATRALSARALAARALAPVLAGKESLSDTLPSALAAAQTADKGLLQALAFTVCRYAFFYRQLLSPLLQRPPQPLIESLLFLGVAQLRDLRTPDHAALSETVEAARELGQERATGMINAVLRRYQREREALEAQAASFLHAHPEWLKARFEADWGKEQATAILAANNIEGALTLRINPQKTSRDDYLSQLAAQEIEATPCAYSAVGIRVTGISDVRTLPGFAAGQVSVQD
jgi:16S rRNA (cytosine967-C5)-methyltransferase